MIDAGIKEIRNMQMSELMYGTITHLTEDFISFKTQIREPDISVLMNIKFATTFFVSMFSYLFGLLKNRSKQEYEIRTFFPFFVRLCLLIVEKLSFCYYYLFPLSGVYNSKKKQQQQDRKAEDCD